MDHGTRKPNLGGTYGNANQSGVIAVKAGPMALKHPGTITHGPGKNKPRIHLVSSKGKIPAEAVAAALKVRQAQHAHLTHLKNHKQGQSHAGVHPNPAQKAMPVGVKDNPKDSAAVEAAEMRAGIRT